MNIKSEKGKKESKKERKRQISNGREEEKFGERKTEIIEKNQGDKERRKTELWNERKNKTQRIIRLLGRKEERKGGRRVSKTKKVIK